MLKAGLSAISRILLAADILPPYQAITWANIFAFCAISLPFWFFWSVIVTSARASPSVSILGAAVLLPYQCQDIQCTEQSRTCQTIAGELFVELQHYDIISLILRYPEESLGNTSQPRKYEFAPPWRTEQQIYPLRNIAPGSAPRNVYWWPPNEIQLPQNLNIWICLKQGS